MIRKILGTTKRPRLSVFRSNKFIYAQIIDDEKGKTLVGVSEKRIKEEKTKTDKAKLLGLLLARQALKHKIDSVVFDRGNFKYHGRVKAFADGVREGGLKF